MTRPLLRVGTRQEGKGEPWKVEIESVSKLGLVIHTLTVEEATAFYSELMAAIDKAELWNTERVYR
jgi:hypothetical protein